MLTGPAPTTCWPVVGEFSLDGRMNRQDAKTLMALITRNRHAPLLDPGVSWRLGVLAVHLVSRTVLDRVATIGREPAAMHSGIDHFLGAVRDASGDRRRYERVVGNCAAVTVRISGHADTEWSGRVPRPRPRTFCVICGPLRYSRQILASFQATKKVTTQITQSTANNANSQALSSGRAANRGRCEFQVRLP